MRSIPFVHHHGVKPAKLEGTTRFEAFSDGVVAILITLLIFEVHVPQIKGASNAAVWTEIVATLPQLATFAVSFVIIAIFWVNHYHFTHNISHTDYKLLWYNNFLLFWLALVPFTTAFLGQDLLQPIAVSVYSFVLFMGALSFRFMTNYAYGRGQLNIRTLPEKTRNYLRLRGLLGVILYGAATVIAPFAVYLSLAVLVIVPLAYFAPVTVGEEI